MTIDPMPGKDPSRGTASPIAGGHCRIAPAIMLLAVALTVATPLSALAELLVQGESRGKPGGLPTNATLGAVIPGLGQHAVPQGLAYRPDRDWYLVSLYRSEPSPAAFVVAIDAATERVVRCRTLLEEDARPHRGHVGGVAADNSWVWVASGDTVFRIPLAAVTEEGEEGSVRMTPLFKPPCAASFVAILDDTLWVVEFVDHASKKYPGCKKPAMDDRRGTPVRAWLAGYSLGEDGSPLATARVGRALVPDLLLAIPEKTQGVAFHGGRVFVSSSFGRRKESRLRAFADPLPRERDAPHATVRLGAKEVPLWFLDVPLAPAWMPPTLPPLAEGIAVRNDTLTVVFESGATEYAADATVAIDRLVGLRMSID
jgi:hypothetical protein